MAKRRVALITDSTCDIPSDLLDRYDVTIVPCYIVWGEDQVRDLFDITPSQFYARLQTDPIYPKTAQPTPADFVNAFRALAEDGHEAILCILISADMSGTLASAIQAAQMVDIPIEIVDARGPSMTIGWQVLAAARTREALQGQGASAQETVQAMVASAAQARGTMQQWVLMDTIEYLRKGGRIGLASHWVGAMLNLKPLIHIDHVAGLVAPSERIRGKKRSVEMLLDRATTALKATQQKIGGDIHVAVLHGGVPDQAAALAAKVKAALDPVEFLISIPSPVLGVSTGPGALAICGYVSSAEG